MTRVRAAFAGVLLLTSGGLGQDASRRLEFEVASIRPTLPARPNGMGISGGPGTADPTRVRYGFFTLPLLLMSAYDMTGYQVAGPIDANSRYDVIATLPPGATQEQARVMLQNLLIDRFHLALHRETRILPLYELVVGKNGAKLKQHADGPASNSGLDVKDGDIAVKMAKDRLHMFGKKTAMKELARVLSDDLAMPVVDKTGLTGEYDFDFEYSRAALGGFAPGAADAADTSGAPNLLTAVQEALGLKLEAKKGSVDMLIVDHAEKDPAQN